MWPKGQVVDCMAHIELGDVEVLQIMHVHVRLLERLTRREMEIASHLVHLHMAIHSAAAFAYAVHLEHKTFSDALLYPRRVRERPASCSVCASHVFAGVAAILLLKTRWLGLASAIARATVVLIQMFCGGVCEVNKLAILVLYLFLLTTLLPVQFVLLLLAHQVAVFVQ